MKPVRYLLGCVLTALVLYHSVYFRKLDEVVKDGALFSASAYARDFWENTLPARASGALELSALLPLLETDKDSAFGAYARSLGIGNIRYFPVKGEGVIAAVEEDYTRLRILPNGRPVTIATEYIVGNAVRDGFQAVNLQDFASSTDINDISAELNRIIREEVLPPFRQKAGKGDTVSFTGAIELNRAYMDLQTIEVLPVQLTLKP